MYIVKNKTCTLREQKGISQENLAFDLGITQPYYARLEKDDDKISITRLIQIANILKTNVSELIDEKTQKVSHQNNNETANSYNVDTINSIFNADKDHINTLKDEILFLRTLLSKNA